MEKPFIAETSGETSEVELEFDEATALELIKQFMEDAMSDETVKDVQWALHADEIAHLVVRAIIDILNETDHNAPILILFVGYAGSGKTGLCLAVARHFGASVLIQDAYLLSRDARPDDPADPLGAKYELDHMAEHTVKVLAGYTVAPPAFDPETRTYVAPEPVRPMPVVIVEGVTAATVDDLRRRADVIVFVEADREIRTARELRRAKVRHAAEQSQGPEEFALVEQRIRDKPDIEDKLVVPQRRYADIIVRTDLRLVVTRRRRASRTSAG